MATYPAGRGFDDAYLGVPPWDIGRSQQVVVDLAAADALAGDVIDLGCGTGENALAIAERGSRVLGIDASPRAVGKSINKARERGLTRAEFLVADVFSLEGLGRTFDAALDCGLFHVFDDHERPVYAASLAGVVRPGGTLYVLCFSDREPPGWGPRRVSEAELRSTFIQGWQVRAVVPAVFETNLEAGGVAAWLATIDRARAFVPDRFEAPGGLEATDFTLEPLGPEHNELDHASWMSSIDHIHATPGFDDPDDPDPWPVPMTLEGNLADLVQHQRDFEERRGFTYTVLDALDRDIIGCVYIYPSADASYQAHVKSWVRVSRAELDAELWRAVSGWLEGPDWPFDRWLYAPRES